MHAAFIYKSELDQYLPRGVGAGQRGGEGGPGGDDGGVWGV